MSDEKKRDIYNKYGEEGLKNGDSGGFHDPFDIFAQFSRGFGGFGRQEREKKGPEVTIPLEVELQDVFLGKVIEVNSLALKCFRTHQTKKD